MCLFSQKFYIILLQNHFFRDLILNEYGHDLTSCDNRGEYGESEDYLWQGVYLRSVGSLTAIFSVKMSRVLAMKFILFTLDGSVSGGLCTYEQSHLPPCK